MRQHFLLFKSLFIANVVKLTGGQHARTTSSGLKYLVTFSGVYLARFILILQKTQRIITDFSLDFY